MKLCVVAMSVVVMAQSGRSQVPPATAPPPATPAPAGDRTPNSPETGKPNQPRLNRPAPRNQRKTTVKPYNPDIDVRAAIEAAIKRASTDNKRVLVIWGDNGSVWAERIFDHLRIPAAASATLYHYEIVWADIGDPTIGPINIALAQSYGLNPAPAPGLKEMPSFSVIESIGPDAGKAIMNRSSKGLEDARKLKAGQWDFNPGRFEDFLLEHKRSALVASEVMERARAEAKTRGVALMLNFDEVSDGWCIRFRWWLVKPEVRAVLDKHFVVARIDLNRMVDAFKLFDTVSGGKATANPWYVFIDADGKRLAPAAESKEEDLGFPTGEEIARFTAMLKLAAPKISDEELKVIELSLEAEAQPATGK